MNLWRDEINRVINTGDLDMWFQGVYRVTDPPTLVGHEALARPGRIAALPPVAQSPDVWFAKAWEYGLGAELEMLAVTRAINAVDRLPGYVSVNVSAETILLEPFLDMLVGQQRVVIELTEQQVITSYTRLRRALDRLRGHRPAWAVRVTDSPRGPLLAIDDVAQAHSGILRVQKLHPDIIKVDRALISGIGLREGEGPPEDVAEGTYKASILSGLVTFAVVAGVTLVAEGVEEDYELDALRALGVDCAQGFLLDRPAALDEVLGPG